VPPWHRPVRTFLFHRSSYRAGWQRFTFRISGLSATGGAGYWVLRENWNGVLVDRHYLTAVDGGRVILPLPKPIHEQRDGKTTVVRYEVTRFHRAFARLIHNAEPGEDFDQYYTEAGFVTVDNLS
jgi:hypothetical protein